MKQGNIAILGSGNIGISLARGLVKANYINAGQLCLTRRNMTRLNDLADEGFNLSTDNIAAVQAASIVVLAVLPQQLNVVLDQIAPYVDPQKHLLISVASGVSCREIRNKLNGDVQVVRAMPNTAIAIGQSMTCVATDNGTKENIAEVISMFETVGAVISINEDLTVK